MCSPSSDCFPWSICLGLLLQVGWAGRDLRCDAHGTHWISHPVLQGRELVWGGDFRCLGALMTSSSLGLLIGRVGAAIPCKAPSEVVPILDWIKVNSVVRLCWSRP